MVEIEIINIITFNMSINNRIKLYGTVNKILILIYFIILVAEVYLYGTENTYIDYSSAIYN